MTDKDKVQREIRKIAYAIWMEDGQPEGRDREHWEAAKAIWAFRNSEADEQDDMPGTSKPRRGAAFADKHHGTAAR